MKKRVPTIILIILFSIFSLNLLNAQPPFQPSIIQGYSLFPSLIEYHPANTSRIFHLHILNQSNGYPINSSIICYFHLYNNLGNHIAQIVDSVPSDIFDYEFSVNSNNFSINGFYEAKFTCENVGDYKLGGGVSYLFQVNKLGKPIEVSESILYLLLTMSVFSVFLMFLYFNIRIPYRNIKGDEGSVIQITKVKYLKIGMILITYSLFVWFLNLLIGLSDNYVNLPMFYGFVSFLFQLLNKLALPLFIMIFVWAMFSLIRDLNIYNMIKQKQGR